MTSREKEIATSLPYDVDLTGIIIAIDWDDAGNPIMIAVAAENEQEYIVNETEGKGAELRKLLQKRVKVSGKVDACLSEIKTLTVRRYEPLKDFTASTLFAGSNEAGRFNPGNARG